MANRQQNLSPEDLEALELGRALLAEDARRRRLEEAEEEAEMKTEEDEEGSGGVKVKEEAHDEDVQDPRETGSADAAQQQEDSGNRAPAATPEEAPAEQPGRDRYGGSRRGVRGHGTSSQGRCLTCDTPGHHYQQCYSWCQHCRTRDHLFLPCPHAPANWYRRYVRQGVDEAAARQAGLTQGAAEAQKNMQEHIDRLSAQVTALQQAQQQQQGSAPATPAPAPQTPRTGPLTNDAGWTGAPPTPLTGHPAPQPARARQDSQLSLQLPRERAEMEAFAAETARMRREVEDERARARVDKRQTYEREAELDDRRRRMPPPPPPPPATRRSSVSSLAERLAQPYGSYGADPRHGTGFGQSLFAPEAGEPTYTAQDVQRQAEQQAAAYRQAAMDVRRDVAQLESQSREGDSMLAARYASAASAYPQPLAQSPQHSNVPPTQPAVARTHDQGLQIRGAGAAAATAAMPYRDFAYGRRGGRGRGRGDGHGGGRGGCGGLGARGGRGG